MDEPRKFLAVYHGHRWNYDHTKRYHLWSEIASMDDQTFGRKWYLSKKIHYEFPGCVYQLESPAGEPDKVYTHTSHAQYIGTIADEELRTKLQFEARADDLIAQSDSERKKEQARNLIGEHLDPLREAYSNASTMQERAYLLAIVTEYITRR